MTLLAIGMVQTIPYSHYQKWAFHFSSSKFTSGLITTVVGFLFVNPDPLLHNGFSCHPLFQRVQVATAVHSNGPGVKCPSLVNTLLTIYYTVYRTLQIFNNIFREKIIFQTARRCWKAIKVSLVQFVVQLSLLCLISRFNMQC